MSTDDNDKFFVTGFQLSPFLALGAGILFVSSAFGLISWPKGGSNAYAGIPFPVGWGRGWGRYRKKMSSAIFLLVIGFFSPLMFMDA